MPAVASYLKKLWHNTLLRQVVIVLGFVELYQVCRSMIFKPGDWDAAMSHAAWVMHFEQVFHLSWEASVQHFFLRLPDVVKAMNLYYFVCQFAVTGLVMLWLFYRDRVGFFFVRNALILASLIGFVIYWRFPTAPPRIAEGGIVDTIRQLSGIDLGHSPNSVGVSNPVAAVPSLHATWAIGVGYALWRYGRRWWSKALALVYPASVFATIVATGNHFVFDALAGVLVMLIGFAMVSAITRVTGVAPAEAPAVDGERLAR